MISEFEHLASHIKNLDLEEFFESGTVGLAIFLLALVLGLTSAIRAARWRMPVRVAISGAPVGFAVVGTARSLLDDPRPAFLCFVVLLGAQLVPGLALQEQLGPRDEEGTVTIESQLIYSAMA